LTNPQTEKKQKTYFAKLNALRFFAAFSVFLFHFASELKGQFQFLTEYAILKPLFIVADKGNLGVNFFFVLSGFLITYLILEEQKHFGNFNLLKFLGRRTLRIWPLYFIIILIGFLLFPFIFESYTTKHQAINYVLFLANFDEIWFGATDPINFLTSPWSVAVEEQFYLFWGVALAFFLPKKWFRLDYFIYLLMFICTLFRWKYWTNEEILYYHTLAVSQDILTGSIFALALFDKRKWVLKIIDLKRLPIFALYLTGFLICIFKNKIFADEWVILERLVLSLFFIFIVLEQSLNPNSFFKVGRLKAFNYLGKISYGLYMYHLLVMWLIIKQLTLLNLTWPVFAFVLFVGSSVLTIIISSLSYRFIESKFLALKPSR
jgi:peptidoglycan/LPS O-acetylase OafA/YrhL